MVALTNSNRLSSIDSRFRVHSLGNEIKDISRFTRVKQKKKNDWLLSYETLYYTSRLENLLILKTKTKTASKTHNNLIKTVNYNMHSADVNSYGVYM